MEDGIDGGITADIEKQESHMCSGKYYDSLRLQSQQRGGMRVGSLTSLIPNNSQS